MATITTTTETQPATPTSTGANGSSDEQRPEHEAAAAALSLWVPRPLHAPTDASCTAAALTLTVALAAAQHGSVPANLLHLISPFRAHHDEVRVLGRGGFGQVALVRSRLDHRLLAVKEVRFSSALPPWSPPELLERQHDKLLREVRALAALSWSPHVVRYVTAWVEPDWVRLGTQLAAQAHRHPALAQLLCQAQQAPHGPGGGASPCAPPAPPAAPASHAMQLVPAPSLAQAAAWWQQQQQSQGPQHLPPAAPATLAHAPLSPTVTVPSSSSSSSSASTSWEHTSDSGEATQASEAIGTNGGEWWTPAMLLRGAASLPNGARHGGSSASQHLPLRESRSDTARPSAWAGRPPSLRPVADAAEASGEEEATDDSLSEDHGGASADNSLPPRAMASPSCRIEELDERGNVVGPATSSSSSSSSSSSDGDSSSSSSTEDDETSSSSSTRGTSGSPEQSRFSLGGRFDPLGDDVTRDSAFTFASSSDAALGDGVAPPAAPAPYQRLAIVPVARPPRPSPRSTPFHTASQQVALLPGPAPRAAAAAYPTANTHNHQQHHAAPSRPAAAAKKRAAAADASPCDVLGGRAGLTRWPWMLRIAMEPVPGLTLDKWVAQRNRQLLEGEAAAAAQRRGGSGGGAGVAAGGERSGGKVEGGDGMLLALGSLEKEVFRQLVQGLAHVHAAGIIHRDVKPANIFVVPAGPEAVLPEAPQRLSPARHAAAPASRPWARPHAMGRSASLAAGSGSGSNTSFPLGGGSGAVRAASSSSFASYTASAAAGVRRLSGGGVAAPGAEAVLVKIGDFGLSTLMQGLDPALSPGFEGGTRGSARRGAVADEVVVVEGEEDERGSGQWGEVGGTRLHPAVSIHTATSSGSGGVATPTSVRSSAATSASFSAGSGSGSAPGAALAAAAEGALAAHANEGTGTNEDSEGRESSHPNTSNGSSGSVVDLDRQPPGARVPDPGVGGARPGAAANVGQLRAAADGGAALHTTAPDGDGAAAPAAAAAAFSFAARAASGGAASDSTARTSGIGTASYAAPEQQAGPGQYGAEVDVYPLGLILLELAVPFATGMERAMALQDARRRTGCRLPPHLEAHLPREAALIRAMLSLDPGRRPSCWHILAALDLIWAVPPPPSSSFSSATTVTAPPAPASRRPPHTFWRDSASAMSPRPATAALPSYAATTLRPGAGSTAKRHQPAALAPGFEVPASVAAAREAEAAPMEMRDAAAQTDAGDGALVSGGAAWVADQGAQAVLHEYQGRWLTGTQLLELLLARDAELAHARGKGR